MDFAHQSSNRQLAGVEVPLGSLYHPIEAGKAFRILLLQPATQLEDTLICDLLPTRLDGDAEYEALSYVWGEASPPGPVLLNGHEKSITPNLESALRYLRYTENVRSLWVDALCIDQDNLEERSKHVQHMSEIYKRCTRDILCLKALNEVRGLNDVARREGRAHTSDLSIRNELKRHKAQIKRLFQGNVWSRAWIVQEVAFAPEVLLVAGNSTMSWDEIEQLLNVDEFVEKTGIPDAFHEPWGHDLSLASWLKQTFYQAQVFSHQRIAMTTRENGSGSSLLEVLARFRHQQVTDPRDMVFALLALCSDTLGIEPDYTRPVEDIYVETSKRIMEHDGNLDLICQGPWQLFRDSQLRHLLPSWAPDFSDPGASRLLFAQRDIFSAGPAKLTAPLSISTSHALVVGGWDIDTLAAVRSGPAQGQSRNPARMALESMPEDVLRQAIAGGADASLGVYLKSDNVEPPFHGGKEAAFDAYWRTLMMDCVRHPNRRPDEADLERLGTLFKDWILQDREEDSGWTSHLESDLDYEIWSPLRHTIRLWRFAVTEQGYYCMVPPTAGVGMHVVALPGAKVPVVLKKVENGKFEMVGPCYVHGFMDGQAYQGEREKTKRTFEIV
ncbi:uncharacterized protein LTR77_004306 [Saxophila tyrrhenica]|uniref:Heterokaryon incompatibility domain-containing protein n=1 Tax=Saxophila tyrrhenica TaxID=1690608 RepID=A0AAV9PFS9_9PEZI|nr:hypothetical protein LTR77_004306 [Saxophila tyrrhenica]